MKRIFLTSVLVIVVTATFIVAGMFIVRDHLNRLYDVNFLSIDEEARIMFTDVSNEKNENHFEFSHYNDLWFCPIENDLFYNKYINSNPNYLYTVEESGDYLSKEHNEKLYVFMTNKHYFFVVHGELGVSIHDGMRTFDASYYSFAAHIPCLENFSGKEEFFVPWEASVGLSSYEDLLVYYSKLPNTVYKVDEENKIFYLSVYNNFLGWMESGVKLEVSDTGFKITLMPEFYNMEVDWDLF